MSNLIFSTATAFVAPHEREEYDDFCADYLLDLTPKTAVEDTLADEIIQAAWRLRRCAAIEQQEIPADADPEQLERRQASIDRARATAQRVYHKSLTELRRVQSERVYRKIALPEKFDTKDLGHASCRQLKPVAVQKKKEKVDLDNSVDDVLRRGREIYEEVEREFAKQSQFEPAGIRQIARSAPCPCGSGDKYKRCCGRNAAPLLGTAA